MFYIVKKEGSPLFEIYRIENITDATYKLIKDLVAEIRGQFGRRDYAQIWCDFENKLITRKELRRKLEL